MSRASVQLRDLARISDLRIQSAERALAQAQAALSEADGAVTRARQAVATFDTGFPARRAALSREFSAQPQLCITLGDLKEAVDALMAERELLTQDLAQTELARQGAEIAVQEAQAQLARQVATRHKRESLAQDLRKSEARQAEALAEQDI